VSLSAPEKVPHYKMASPRTQMIECTMLKKTSAINAISTINKRSYGCCRLSGSHSAAMATVKK